VSFTHDGPGSDARPDVSELPDVLMTHDGADDSAVIPDAGADAAPILDAAPDAGCGPGAKPCGSSCVSLSDPATGCAAATCEPCDFTHGAALCIAGACALGTCENLWGNCDLDAATGCETDLTSTLDHCGACGDPCSLPHATMSCQASVCQFQGCDTDYRDCDGNLQSNGCETNTGYDNQNCGSCGTVCAPGFNCNNTACRCVTDADCNTGGGGTCDSFYKLCLCPTSFCYGPCQTDGTGCL